MSEKSPLKSKPLRNPGESSEKQLQDIIIDRVFPFAGFAAVMIAVALLEWVRWYSKTPPSPWLFSGVALFALGVLIWKILAGKRMARNLKLGRDGEKAVGQFLEKLRESGAEVFHDMPGEGFNLDHVVVHNSGIYVVETKTNSIPMHGGNKLIYNGKNVSKNGLKPDRNPVHQVRAARKWLSELVRESTGKAFPVRGVVVYPGWFVEATGEAKSSDVWVLNPKMLPSYILQSKAKMKPEDVKLCSFHLSRYIRTVES